MRRVFVDPEFPQRDAIQEAAKWIVNGGVVALPTDTLYGLGADPFSAAAVARVFAVKGRAAERALPLIAADAAQVATHLGRLDAVAQLPAAPAASTPSDRSTSSPGWRRPPAPKSCCASCRSGPSPTRPPFSAPARSRRSPSRSPS